MNKADEGTVVSNGGTAVFFDLAARYNVDIDTTYFILHGCIIKETPKHDAVDKQ